MNPLTTRQRQHRKRMLDHLKKVDGRGRWKRTDVQTQDEKLQKTRDWRRLLRRDVIMNLGGECACCGESQFEFLTVDHVHNDGKEHRARAGSLGVLLDIRRAGYPRDRYEVLCYNCNLGRAFNGSACPHNWRGES